MPPEMPLDSASSMVGPGVIASASEATMKSRRVLTVMASCDACARARACQGRFDDGALAVGRLRRRRGRLGLDGSCGSRADALPRRMQRVALQRVHRPARCDHACQPLRPGVTFSSEMQSTGQTGMHSSQPVQCGSITVCMRLWMPRMASVGQASRHSVQPMHQASSITAIARGPSTPNCGSSGSDGRPVMAASRAMPSAPPGGHWLMPASPSAMACA